MKLHLFNKKAKLIPLITVALAFPFLTSNLALGQKLDKNKLPEIGTSAVSSLSLDKERQIGDIMMRQLRSSQPIINDPVLIEYINHLGNTLVKNAQDVNYKFKFFLINNNELNAFAFFGGHVAVHSSIIGLSDDESELASVLAHEISHVTQRHLARRMEAQTRNQPLSTVGMISGILLAMINPTVGFAALSTSIAASQQMSINYTRGNEKEADRVGIALLANSHFDPLGAPAFFKKLADKYRYATKPPAMLLTHPLPNSRITDARNRAQSYPYVRLPANLDFELAKARVKARYQGEPEENIDFYKKQIEKKRYVIKAAAYYGLALSFFEDKQYQQAQEILQTLKASDNKNLFYVDVLSDIYIQTKQFDKAIKMLSALNLLMPNNQIVTLNYANVLNEAKQANKAAVLLQDFLLVQPDNFIAYDLLTGVYTKQKKKALIHTTKAEVLALLGNYPRAIDELQTAYNYADHKPLVRKRIKARILQFQAQEDKLKRL
jgi:beta-barrel assembly-enhancing protease